MTYFVPDFELDEEKTSLASTLLRHKVVDSSNEAFAELVWRNGPVAHQLHSPLREDRFAAADAGRGGGGGFASLTAEPTELFMEEDEMAMWLDSQMADCHGGGGNLYSELLDPLPGADGRAQERQQPLPPLTTERRQGVLGSGEFETVVSSEESPEVAEAAGRVLEKEHVRAPLEDWGPRACDRELGSSSGADEGIGLKRKARERLVPECHSEEVEFEDGNRRKDARHSSSTRRTRAAEVHNLSERRRRDRINEKMKALQDLVPRCNKSDKASMLEDAIEYLKSLQLQVQMMSMGCNMGPVVFLDNQRYVSPIGTGMGMGMYMCMGMTSGMDTGGQQRPMTPLGSVLPCPSVAGAARAYLRPPLVPSFHSPNMAVAEQLRMQASNQQDPSLSSANMLASNMVQIPNAAGPYHPYIGLLHGHVPCQDRLMAEPGSTKETKISGKPS